MSDKLTHEQFTLLAIEKLASPGKNAIHTVWSGFNAAFKEQFPGENPVDATKKLLADGKISMRPIKGGVLIAKPGVFLPTVKPEDALAKMGIEKK
jgi:hypothetical protein